MLRIQWACSSGTAAQQGGCQRIKRAIISRNGKRQLRVVGQMLQPFRIRARGMEAGLSAAPAILPVSMHTLVRIAVFKVGLACFLWGGQPPSQMLCADGAQGGDPVRVVIQAGNVMKVFAPGGQKNVAAFDGDFFQCFYAVGHKAGAE